MTRHPCTVVMCCAYAAPDSNFCPAHASLHAHGGLTLITGRLDTGRRPRTRQRREEARLPFEPRHIHRTE